MDERMNRKIRQMTPAERDEAKDKAIAAGLAFAKAWRDDRPHADMMLLYLSVLVTYARVETNIAEPEKAG